MSESVKAIYRQIAEDIGDDIILGKYGEESRLPSVREYAAAMEVNSNTVMRAYDWLASYDIIYNRRGIGFFVSAGAVDRVRQIKYDAAMRDMKNIFRRMEIAGITPEKLTEAYRLYLRDSSNNI